MLSCFFLPGTWLVYNVTGTFASAGGGDAPSGERASGAGSEGEKSIRGFEVRAVETHRKTSSNQLGSYYCLAKSPTASPLHNLGARTVLIWCSGGH